MEFRQKKGKNDIKFEITSDHLKYFIKDETSKGEYTVEYDSISPNKYELTEKNDNYKNYAIYLLVLSIIFLAGTIFLQIRSNALLFLFGSIVLYILYQRSKVTFTVLEGEHKIYVIKDDQHDKILEKIKDARKEYMIQKYAKVNLSNNVDNELRKFAWLLKQNIITQEEFEEIKSLLVPPGKKPLAIKSTKRLLS